LKNSVIGCGIIGLIYEIDRLGQDKSAVGGVGHKWVLVPGTCPHVPVGESADVDICRSLSVGRLQCIDRPGAPSGEMGSFWEKTVLGIVGW
jgi:hypothetical protein